MFPSTLLLIGSLLAHTVLASHDYHKAHSYHNTTLKERDGWDTVSVSDLAYKYPPSSDKTDSTRSHYRFGRQAHKSANKKKSSQLSPSNILDSALKGIGEATSVIITWYTGNDLKNPSCWETSVWTPTDDSFACALTLDGWTTRPKCFSFLELCNGPKKCIFVRVVDTCAGCAKGSKHVDLTKAAFTKLAPLGQGLLNVQMRLSTPPKTWDINLWGPKN